MWCFIAILIPSLLICFWHLIFSKKNAHKASSGVRTSQLLISLSVSATITKHRGGKRQSIIFNKCVNRLSCLNFENSKYTGIENAHAIYSFPQKMGIRIIAKCQDVSWWTLNLCLLFTDNSDLDWISWFIFIFE